MGEKLPEVDLGSDVYAIDIQIGYTHTCALTYEQQLKCWGSNDYGQLGLGNNNNYGKLFTVY